MFKVGQIVAPMTADLTGFTKKLAKAKTAGSKAADDISQSFRDVGRKMQGVGMAMTAGITAPLIGAGGLALKTAADYESLRMSMNALNGSVEEGTRNFERLKRFSAETPFQLRDLAEAQNMLQGFGQEADAAFNSMKMIGDIAAITGGDIKGIGIAFGQAAAEGRLMTRDIRQLINQGVPAIKLLADTMGVAQSEVLDLASQGEISFEILQEAFRDATSEGGMFANGMQRQADTLKGVFSTLKDNVSIALGEIGNAIQETFDVKGIMDSMIENIKAGTKWFNSLAEETRKAAFMMAGVLGASGPIIAALGTLSVAIGTISAPIAGMAAVFGAATAAIVANWDDIVAYFTTGSGAQLWETIKQGGKEIYESLKGFFTAASSLIGTFSNEWGTDITGAVTMSVRIISEAVTKIIDSMSLIINLIRGDWSAAWKSFKDVATTNIQNLDKEMFLGMSSMMQSATAMTNLLTGDFKTAWEQFKFGYGFNNIYSQYSESTKNAKKETDNFLKSLTDATGILTGESFATAQFNVKMGVDQKSKEKVKQSFKDFNIGTSGIKSVTQEMNMLSNATRGFDKVISGIPKSLGETNEKLSITQIALRDTTAKLNSMAIAIKEKFNLNALTSSQINWLNTLTDVANNFTQSFGQGMANVVVQGQKLVDTLENIGKLLASSVIQKGLSILLSGGLAGGGFFGSGGGLLGNLFGSIFGANDAFVDGDGNVTRFSASDGFLAMKDFSALGNKMGGGGQMSMRSMQRAFENALSNTVQEAAPSRVFELSQKGKRGF